MAHPTGGGAGELRHRCPRAHFQVRKWHPVLGPHWLFAQYSRYVKMGVAYGDWINAYFQSMSPWPQSPASLFPSPPFSVSSWAASLCRVLLQWCLPFSHLQEVFPFLSLWPGAKLHIQIIYLQRSFCCGFFFVFFFLLIKPPLQVRSGPWLEEEFAHTLSFAVWSRCCPGQLFKIMGEMVLSFQNQTSLQSKNSCMMIIILMHSV